MSGWAYCRSIRSRVVGAFTTARTLAFMCPRRDGSARTLVLIGQAGPWNEHSSPKVKRAVSARYRRVQTPTLLYPCSVPSNRPHPSFRVLPRGSVDQPEEATQCAQTPTLTFRGPKERESLPLRIRLCPGARSGKSRDRPLAYPFSDFFESPPPASSQNAASTLRLPRPLPFFCPNPRNPHIRCTQTVKSHGLTPLFPLSQTFRGQTKRESPPLRVRLCPTPEVANPPASRCLFHSP